MTMQHVIHGLMQVTKVKNHHQLSVLFDVPQGIISRLAHGKFNGMSMANLSQIQSVSGVSFDTIFAWYRLPTHAPMEMAVVEAA